jgi:hypothetical protein
MTQSEFLSMLSTMPPLAHSVDGVPFSIDRSEAVAWIMAQPGFKDWVWNKARNSERIAYDKATGKWSGVSRRPRHPSVSSMEVGP